MIYSFVGGPNDGVEMNIISESPLHNGTTMGFQHANGWVHMYRYNTQTGKFHHDHVFKTLAEACEYPNALDG